MRSRQAVYVHIMSGMARQNLDRALLLFRIECPYPQEEPTTVELALQIRGMMLLDPVRGDNTEQPSGPARDGCRSNRRSQCAAGCYDHADRRRSGNVDQRSECGAFRPADGLGLNESRTRHQGIVYDVNSLPTVTPFSRPIATPLGVQEWACPRSAQEGPAPAAQRPRRCAERRAREVPVRPRG